MQRAGCTYRGNHHENAGTAKEFLANQAVRWSEGSTDWHPRRMPQTFMQQRRICGMRESTRAGRNAIAMSPEAMRHFESERAAWFETSEEIEEGIEWGKRKALLLHWVRRQMNAHLTERERRCVELYFFESHTYREIGRITGTNASSAYRAVARSLRKLRVQAKENGPKRGVSVARTSSNPPNPAESDSAREQNESA